MELGKPEGLAARSLKGRRVELTWRRPKDDFAYQFRVYVRRDGEDGWRLETDKVTPPTDHLHPEDYMYTSHELEPCTRYVFKVEAYTTVGARGPAVELNVVAGEAPPADAPTNLRLLAAEFDSITIAWDPPTTCNGQLTTYTIDWDAAGSDRFNQTTVPGHTTTFTASYLDVGTMYRFQVSAMNASGEGPASTVLTAQTIASALARFSDDGGSGAAASVSASAASSSVDKTNDAGDGNADDVTQNADALSHVPPHRRLSIRGAAPPPPPASTDDGDTDGRQSAFARLRRASTSAIPPKGVWSPAKPQPPPEPTPLQPWERTNPDAVGTAAARRRQSQEHKFVRRHTETSAEFERRIEAARRSAVAAAHVSSVVSGGAANDAPDERMEIQRKKREFWAATLRRDRKDRGSAAARELVGDEDAQRLVRRGDALNDGTGDARGYANGVTAALGHFNLNDVVWQNELTRKLYFIEKNQTIVLYITSLEAVRRTRDDCSRMLKIFETMCLKVRVKDVHLEPRFADELCMRVERFQIGSINGILPQCFINAVHIGGVDEVIHLVDTGELKDITKDFERRADDFCKKCGNTGFIICAWCQGSNKSRVHQFNDDPRKNALRCTICNANGLVTCPSC
eukprot:m.26611 g.26611  ORF g.26611 m.26611 type:complete len:628 (+) comp4329_c0_seq1:315-2198(+)